LIRRGKAPPLPWAGTVPRPYDDRALDAHLCKIFFVRA